MPSLSEYFDRICYKPKYFMGDRVKGKFHKIPFIGTVGNDSLVSETEGPKVSIFLDLPLKYKGVYYKMITVKHKDITYFK